MNKIKKIVFGILAVILMSPSLAASEITHATEQNAEEISVGKSFGNEKESLAEPEEVTSDDEIVKTDAVQVNKQRDAVNYAPERPTPEQVAAANPTDVVIFWDKPFEETIAEMVGTTPGNITVEDMSKIVNLKHTNKKLKFLYGIEYAVNLEQLNLSNNNISDLRPIIGLTKLHEIDVSMNWITYLVPLENLLKLEKLNLSTNRIGQLSLKPLSPLTKLKHLDLSSNEITIISPLASLLNLEYLDLGYNKLTEIDGLESLINLEYLSLSSNQISEITELADLKKLKELYITNNKLVDIVSLTELVNLTKLDLNTNQIIDISGLTNLTKLEKLYVADNKIINVEPLSQLINLSVLEIYHNEITDITAFSDLVNLVDLGAASNQISDITPLKNCTKLRFLNLRMNNIEDISVISNYKNLERLNIIYNNIKELPNLDKLGYLEVIYLDNNKISDLSPLSRLRPTNTNKNIGNLHTISVLNQKVDLPEITVTSSNEIIYNIIGFDEIKYPVVLGNPVKGENLFSSDIAVPNISYSATVSQKVFFREINGKLSAKVKEGNILSDEDLIKLFEVSSFEGKPVIVNQSAIDYNVPGTYEVVFSNEADEITRSLIVEDLIPTIEITNDTITVKAGSSIQNFVQSFGVVATEINAGDLTSIVIVDDSSVDYNTIGKYDINFSVADEEGNNVEKSATILVISNNEAITKQDPSKNDEKIIKSDKVEDIKNDTEAQPNNKVMTNNTNQTLQSTGNNQLFLVSLLILIIGIVVTMKKEY